MPAEPNPFALTEEQHRLIEDTRGIARDVLVALVDSGEPGRVNRPLVEALAAEGLLGRMFPSRAGGSRQSDEGSAVDLCLLREALAQESTEAETALAMQGIGAYPIPSRGAKSWFADGSPRWPEGRPSRHSP